MFVRGGPMLGLRGHEGFTFVFGISLFPEPGSARRTPAIGCDARLVDEDTTPDRVGPIVYLAGDGAQTLYKNGEASDVARL